MTFDKRITVLRSVKAGDSAFSDESWEPVCTVWANWVNVHGSEAWIADSVQASKAATVTIRYRDGIDETCRISYKGVIYEIVSVDNVRERNRALELKVRASVNG